MIEAGKHGFSGNCAPNKNHGAHNTFSYGIYEFLIKASGKGIKKGPVKVRVSGSTNNEAAVRAKTEEIVAALDAGAYSGPKRVRL